MTAFSISYIWLIVGLLGVGWKDETQRRIPNATLLALTLLWMVWTPVELWQKEWMKTEGFSFLLRRILLALTVLFGTALFAWLRPQSFGMGDAKLMGVLLLYFDFSSAFVILWASLFFTLLRGVVAHFRHGTTTLPFAPQVAFAVMLFFLVKRW